MEDLEDRDSLLLMEDLEDRDSLLLMEDLEDHGRLTDSVWRRHQNLQLVVTWIEQSNRTTQNV